VESLFLLIPLSILAVAVAVLVFFWMNRDGQFDDDQGPAWSILLDDDRPVQKSSQVQEPPVATIAEQASGSAGDRETRDSEPPTDEDR
jgi:cbb3-type cytochrome oxidase maturation protein